MTERTISRGATVPPLTMEERFQLFAEMIHLRIRELDNAVLNLSQALAEKEHGAELVERALAAARAEEGRLHACLQTGHPYEALASWYKQARPLGTSVRGQAS